MTQAIDKNQIILERLQDLSAEQLQEVLHFMDFLQFKAHKQQKLEEKAESISFLEAAKEFIGSVEGDRDLSMQKKELKRGFHKS